MNDIQLIVTQTQAYQNELLTTLVKRRCKEELAKHNDVITRATQIQTVADSIRFAEERLSILEKQCAQKENQMSLLKQEFETFQKQHNFTVRPKTLQECRGLIAEICDLASEWVGSGCDSYYAEKVTNVAETLSVALSRNCHDN